MASRSDFRVKVDLCKYHQDARRFSWIFVDSANCWFISHVKQHIVNIFGIQEPFHLLLNGNEFLPPTEDVRVLKENEIIVVVPDLGLHNVDASTLSMRLPVIQNGGIKTTEIKELLGAANIYRQDDNQTYNSVPDINNAEGSMSDVAEIESASDSKGTGDNSTNNGRMIDICGIPMRKRKRTRRKKSTKKTETTLPENVDGKRQTNDHKPKIIESYVLPIGNHIRFDNVDTTKVAVIENHPDNLSTKSQKPYASDLPVSKNSGIANLSTLLALRKCSSPLTFLGKKINPRTDNVFAYEECTRNDRSTKFSNLPMDIQGTKNELSQRSSDVAKSTDEQSNYSQLNPEKYPALQSSIELNDIIAFKILRMGKDYSPEISDYIVAKTRVWCPKTLLYTFEILKGQSQIQTPMGKFTLPENDAEDQEVETANFNFSQLIDTRLIHRQ